MRLITGEKENIKKMIKGIYSEICPKNRKEEKNTILLYIEIFENINKIETLNTRQIYKLIGLINELCDYYIIISRQDLIKIVNIKAELSATFGKLLRTKGGK